ncbi:hypothetical protein G3M53_05730 [Streptomyces sp. SID7982]|nr:hypothetical protein [Streptomyces sp. SID7982]
MSETHGEVLRKWLLETMADLEGSAPRQTVHQRFSELFRARLTPEDFKPRVGRPGGESAWRNNLDSLYDRLKREGVMESSTRGDPWKLAKGVHVRPPVTPPQGAIDEEDLFRDFKPQNSSDYVARVQGRVLQKSRAHGGLLNAYSEAVGADGWQPRTTVWPRDLELRRADQVWLAEVKIVYNGNAMHAVRAVLAQLFTYRHFHYGLETRPGLLGVFNEPVGAALEELLDSFEIAVVWREGRSWGASPRAVKAGLLPGSR